MGGLHKGQANVGRLIVSSQIPETPCGRVLPEQVRASFICEHPPKNLRCHCTQCQVLDPQLLFQLRNNQVKKRGTELIELFYKFVRFSDIVEFFIRRMLYDDFREVLANMPLQPI
jgi:hypothetical protein